LLKKNLKKIILNFIINLSPNRRRDGVYDLILIIINKYIKIIRYFFIIKTINIVDFIKFFIDKIIAQYGNLKGIIFNKGFVFISVF